MIAYIADLEARLQSLLDLLEVANALNLCTVSLNSHIGYLEEDLRFARVIQAKVSWLDGEQ